jgi:hypothetical protein
LPASGAAAGGLFDMVDRRKTEATAEGRHRKGTAHWSKFHLNDRQ